jgi:drug/metabolite transporter (DMT)-like permease
VGAVLAVVFLGQEFTTSLWIGGALIGAGVLLALSGDRASARHPASSPSPERD